MRVESSLRLLAAVRSVRRHTQRTPSTRSEQMGKIPGSSWGMEELKLKVRRPGGGNPCAGEVVSYLTCLDANGGNEEMCKAVRQTLVSCMTAHAKAWQGHKRHKPPINFHLQQVCAPRVPCLMPVSSHLCVRCVCVRALRSFCGA